jgi:HAD superfamily hydrolase (TIGR01509 family)
MSIKAVIFDIDNTLLDWSARRVGWFTDADGHIKHLAKAARAFDPHVSDSQIEALVAAFREEQRTIIAEDIEEAPHLGRMIARHLHGVGITNEVMPETDVLEAYNWVTTPDVFPFPDVPDVLGELGHRGYRLGLITNGYQPISQRDVELDAYGLLRFFPECRFSSADVGFLKPDARIFQMALECLQVDPSEAVYVGDDPVMDVIGAQRVGMKAVWRLPSGRDASAWSWVKPDGIVDNLYELMPLLEEWG